MNIAVVTGASSGMGREFVKELDKNDVLDEIWVIARREDRLKKIAEESDTKIVVLPLDLTEKSSIDIYSK
jgi:NADP-dependent 3-hydroxy acid dehydrogenase YdfG